MATIETTAPRYVSAPKRGPITRLLEDERWLATFLMLPTIEMSSQPAGSGSAP